MPARECKYIKGDECPYDCQVNDAYCLNCQLIKMDSRLKSSESTDKVSHPSHYVEGRRYEPKDVIRDWGLNYNLGCVVKYVSRAGRKDDILQDLRKARQYLDFEIEAIEEERNAKNGNA